MNTDELGYISTLLTSIGQHLQFKILEIGARPLEGEKEPFYSLIDTFPGSRIIGFETESELCDKLNRETPDNIMYYPVALGKANETRTFYETNHPMCSSLYKPNEKINNRYNYLDVANLKATSKIQTTGLDKFVKKHHIDPIDFIKIDIQGAELEVFQSGVKALRNTLAIVSEVEFIPMYKNQPLFGEVSAFLHDQKLWFHKFLGLAGRTIKPYVLDGNPYYATQHMWSDAMFVKHLMDPEKLTSVELLKIAVLGYLYQSFDVTISFFAEFDKRESSNLAQQFSGL